MLGFSRLSMLRNELRRKLIPVKISDVKDTSGLSSFTSRLGFSTGRQDLMNNGISGNVGGRKYAEFSIYKGKAALSVSPILPTFTKMESGSSRIERKGVVLLKFLPAIGQRKYDFEKKQLFALSPTELGCLISLGPAESCEFFHDPSMKSSLEGQVKKTLTVSPINDGSGVFFNLTVMNSLQKTSERISLPVTKAEFAVMRTAFSFALPHLMGWDQIVSPQPKSTGLDHLQQREIHIDPSFEWGR